MKIVCLFLERDPDYKFTKNLPKKCEAYTAHTVEFNCQVNSHKANLRWFKNDEELPDVLNDKYTITKDIIGNVGLTIYDANKSDTGTYKCRIDGTKLVTKCALTIKGKKPQMSIRFESLPMKNTKGRLSLQGLSICSR